MAYNGHSHYDAVRLWTPEAEPKDPARPFSGKAGKVKAKNMGYNWSTRRPKGNHLKHKYALDESRLAKGVKTKFFKALTTTAAEGGSRKCICGEKTAAMHWQNMRQSLGLQG